MPTLPLPDGEISPGDRYQLVWLYRFLADAPLVTICPPSISISEITPILTLVSVEPNLMAATLAPMLTMDALEPVITIETLEPIAIVGGCC